MVTLKGLLRLLRAVPVWRPQVLKVLHAEGLTLSALITVAALTNPDGVALIDDDGPLTYADLNRLVEHASAEVNTTRVDVREPNHRSFVVAVAAALRRNADVVLHEPTSPGSAQAPPAPPPTPSKSRPSPRRPHRLKFKRRGQVILLNSGSTGVPKEVERGGVRIAQALPIGTLLGVLPVCAQSCCQCPCSTASASGFSPGAWRTASPWCCGERQPPTQSPSSSPSTPTAYSSAYHQSSPGSPEYKPMPTQQQW
jgi:hypothetical protein